MSGRRLARFLLGSLGVIAALATFMVLDWYPTLKDLGRLRRERSDLERRIRDYRAAAAEFRFPDAGEEALLAATETELCRALPWVGNDDAWTALALVDIESFIRRDRIPHARPIPIAPGVLSGTPGTQPGPARPAGSSLQGSWSGAGTSAGFAMAADPGRFPWQGAFAGLKLHCGQPAGRAVALVAAAPLPALLDFANHASWGETRLEIVRLRVEAGSPLPRAWLVCRGYYRVTGPSDWAVGSMPAGAGLELLIDPFSPLLLQRVDPLFAPGVEKRELPPAGSPW